MSLLDAARFRLRVLLRPRRYAEELEEEVRFHLALEAMQGEHAGRGTVSPADARLDARRRFGNVTTHTEESRTMAGLAFLDVARQDLRFALRTLRAAPGATLVAIATLAVGIAVVTTIFSFVNTALLRPLPYPEPHELVAFRSVTADGRFAHDAVSRRAVEVLQRDARSFSRVAAYAPVHVSLAEPGALATAIEQVSATAVDSALLPLLGARAARGRLPSASEIRGDAPVVLVSDRLWRTRFGARTDIVGRTVVVEGRPHTVVGVAAPELYFPERADLWLPLAAPAADATVDEASVSLIGRLRPDVQFAQAREEVALLGRRLAEGEPDGRTLLLRSEIVDRAPRVWGPFAALLLVAAVAVLLAACSNVVHLFLARAAVRRGEMAVRASLGASRRRLVRQSLTESLLVGAVAGAIGALLSVWAIHAIIGLVPLGNMPRWIEFGVDARVLAFTAGLSLLVVAAVGVLPALESTRFSLADVLKRGAAIGSTRRGTSRRGGILIVTELALALVLCIGSALIGRTFAMLVQHDPGYAAARVLELSLPAEWPRERGWEARAASRYGALAERLAAHPGVAATAQRGWLVRLRTEPAPAASDSLPPGPTDQRIYLPERPEASAPVSNWPQHPQQLTHVVSDAYFETLGLRVLRGRAFGAGDAEGGAPVALVSRELARKLWEDASPIGRQLRLGPDGALLTVVGELADRRDPVFGPQGLSTAPHPELYLSERQAVGEMTMFVRARTDDAAPLAAATQHAAQQLVPGQPVRRPETLAEDHATVTTVVRALGAIFLSFTACALVLALIGIYGVIAHGVAERRREIGIHLALGATPADVVRAAARRGVRLTTIGLVLGAAGAWALARAMRGILEGIAPLDLPTFALAAFAFAAVALLASWLPARRATRVHPMETLREL